MIYQDCFQFKLKTIHKGIILIIGSFTAYRAKSGKIVGQVKIRCYKGNTELLKDSMNVNDILRIDKYVGSYISERYEKRFPKELD